MNFGEYLRRRRAQLGWTQPHAAARAGIEQSYLSKLESGRSIPSGEVYQRLVDALEIETTDMVGVLFPAELDRLRDVDAVRDLLLRRSSQSRSMSRRWLLAGLALLALGGGLAGLAGIDGDRTVQQFTYQSTGVILPGESLDVFEGVDDRPDPQAADHAARIARRDELIGRVEDQTRPLTDYRGPAFIEPAPDGKRVWRLVGGSEARQPGRFRWAGPPGWALILAGLGCFFISWRWPRAGV